MTCKWQVEIDPFCRKVLAKHWPKVVRYEDVRTVGKHNLEPVDVLCGGFPCQDISNAGKRAGIDGERSGLWREFHRIICELRPRYVVVENVTALLVRGMGRVLGDLAKIGFDAEWKVIRAGCFGLQHSRPRLFLVAYPVCERLERERVSILNSPNTCRHVRGSGVSETCILRSRNGFPHYVDRIKGLGNAVVPQVAEWVGRRIVESDEYERRQGR